MLGCLFAFCASLPRRPRLVSSKSRLSPPTIRLSNSPNTLACEVCKQIIVYIEQLILAGYIESEIESLVDQACAELPPPLNTFCTAFVNQYIADIIEWINAGIDNLDICKRIGLCESTTAPQSLACDICKQVVQRVMQMLLEGKIEEEIIETLNQFCDEYAAPYSELCKNILDSLVDTIIKYCEAGLSVDEVCATIGLCDGKRPSVIEK
jgi:saposin